MLEQRCQCQRGPGRRCLAHLFEDEKAHDACQSVEACLHVRIVQVVVVAIAPQDGRPVVVWHEGVSGRRHATRACMQQ